MIEANVFKMRCSGLTCANPECKHLPEYTYHILGNVYFIKVDSVCLRLSNNKIAADNGDNGTYVEYYCRDCIDVVYKKLKPILDSKLWILT